MKKPTLAAALAASCLIAVAAPSGAQDAAASVVVIHGIPDTPVDVYVDDALTLEDFEPGTVTDAIELPGGTYTLDLRAPDADPASDPILTADATVEGGGSYSVVAHLSAGGDPTITPFVNDTAATEAGEGGVVVRHTAAAPAVDVYAGEAKVISSLENPDSAGPLYVPAGTVSASVTAAGATDPVIGPADVPVTEGELTIVYAIGSLEADTLGVVVQTLPVGVDAAAAPTPAPTPAPAAPVPTAVNAGNSGLAADASGPSTVLLAGIAALAVLAGTSGAVSLARARRQG
jgi:hypothetical protein